MRIAVRRAVPPVIATVAAIGFALGLITCCLQAVTGAALGRSARNALTSAS